MHTLSRTYTWSNGLGVLQCKKTPGMGEKQKRKEKKTSRKKERKYERKKNRPIKNLINHFYQEEEDFLMIKPGAHLIKVQFNRCLLHNCLPIWERKAIFLSGKSPKKNQSFGTQWEKTSRFINQVQFLFEQHEKNK